MGLTIHYTMTASLPDRQQVAKVVHAMHRFALDLPFQQVSDVVELGGEEAGRAEAVEAWLRIQGTESVAGCFVEPLDGVGFATLPGPGCESANFAFCTYPAFTQPNAKRARKKTVPTGLEGWRWSSFCKTQYASDPRHGGVENFLRCHLSVIKLLDFARRTGLIGVEVLDEGHYWQNRDLRRLVREVGEWNETVAAVVGLLRPALEAHGKVTAPVTGFPDFEHLEAKGLARLSALWESLGEGGRDKEPGDPEGNG
jgi:hypothetical protein